MNEFDVHTHTFLDTEEQREFAHSLFWLNLYLNAFDESKKPYRIDYNTILVSYHQWKGNNLEFFCEDQTVCYFLFNPQQDSKAAREALFQELQEFLSGQ